MIVSAPSILPTWTLGIDSLPDDEEYFFEIAKKTFENPEWVNASNKEQWCELLTQTQTSNTPIGIKARVIQETFFRKFPDLCGMVTVVMGNQERQVPKGCIKNRFDRFNLYTNFAEADKNRLEFRCPANVDANIYEVFLDFMHYGLTSINEETVVALLQIALDNDIMSLGHACVDFIRKHIPNYSPKIFIYFLDLATKFDPAPEYLLDLQWFYVIYLSEVRSNQAVYNELLKTANVLPAEYHHIKKFITESDKYLAAGQTASFIKHYNRTILADDRVNTIVPGSRCLTYKKEAQNNLKQVTQSLGGLQIADSFLSSAKIRALTLAGSNIFDSDLVKISRIVGKTVQILSVNSSPGITRFRDCQFSALVECSFTDSGLTNQGLQELSVLAGNTLRDLYISNRAFSSNPGKVTFEGCEFKQLSRLTLAQQPLCDAGFDLISRFGKNTLHTLNFVDLPKVPDLDNCLFTKIHTVSFRNLQITNEDFRAFAKSHQKTLRHLDISECNLIDNFRGCELTELVFVTMMGNCFASQGIVQSPSFYPLCGQNLRKLNLQNVRAIDFTHCNFPHLEEVDAEYSRLDNHSIKTLSNAGKESLRILNISNSKNISSFEGCTFNKLAELIADNTSLTDAGLKWVSVACKNKSLLTLNVAGCANITTFEGCDFPRLVTALVYNTGLTTNGLKWLRKSTSTNLQFVHAVGCSDIHSVKFCGFPKTVKVITDESNKESSSQPTSLAGTLFQSSYFKK